MYIVGKKLFRFATISRQDFFNKTPSFGMPSGEYSPEAITPIANRFHGFYADFISHDLFEQNCAPLVRQHAMIFLKRQDG